MCPQTMVISLLKRSLNPGLEIPVYKHLAPDGAKLFVRKSSAISIDSTVRLRPVKLL